MLLQNLFVPFSINAAFTDTGTVTHDAMVAAAFVCVVDVWLCLCMVEFELSLVDVVMNCVNWQWFSEVFLSPRANILYTMMWVFNAAPPEGSKVTAIQCWFWALLLTCRDFSRFSESFDDIMDCRWWNPSIPAVGQSWETLFLNCWTICSRSCWQSGEPGSIFACEGLSLLGMLLLYPIMTLTCLNQPVHLWNDPNSCFCSTSRCWYHIL